MGNGTLLATFDECGEVEQLFAPHIDALQSRIGVFRTSVVIPSGSHGVPELVPISQEQFEVQLELKSGSQVLEICYQHRYKGLRLFRSVALHPSEPALMDCWRVEDPHLGLLHQSIPWMGNSTSAHCSMFHPTFNGIVHHRGRRWLGVIARGQTQWERVGHVSNSDRHRLWDGDRISVPVEARDLEGFPKGPVDFRWDHVSQGCTTWGALAVKAVQSDAFPQPTLEFLIICAESERHLGKLIHTLDKVPTQRAFQMIDAMVERRYEPAQVILNSIQNEQVKEICERSIDVLHALQDRQSGALIAAAEVDPHSRMSGGYGYSWPRDGAYLAAALGAFGFRERVEHYFRFLAETQDVSGAWWQRYLATGHAGPSWGRIQMDEPASVIGVACLHFRKTRDFLWLESYWPTLEKGLGFLEKFHSMEDPLGEPSHDLWEERMGIHAYSLSAVSSAFLSGAYLAGILSEPALQEKYYRLGKQISSQMIEQFFLRDSTHLYRSKLDHYWDPGVDASLLGVIRPFGSLNRRHPVALKILESVRNRLWSAQVGGVFRYEGDHYRGGNPWILTTLWLAYIELIFGNHAEAKRAFQWVMSKVTPQGLLAEQIHRETGKPCWVIPLGWSHAMYLLFVKEVLERKVENLIFDAPTGE